LPPNFRDFVEKVRATADILDVVGRHVELKKAGARYKGLCPFHKEKTPSFIVSPDRQSYHCFGCHVGGDAIDFVARIEGLDWREAAEQLGLRYGLEVPRRAAEQDDEKQRKFFDSVMAALAMAQEFFARTLKSANGRPARDYLKQREIDEKTIAQFGMGLTLDAWDLLAKEGQKKGFSEEILLAAGLLIHNEDRDRTYDRFRDRIMFPICDSIGRPIAFGGRVYRPDAPLDGAKYINSPETPVYRKGHTLYAYHLARDPIKERKCAIVLEGYTDVIALHRHGFTHAVASLGTALTAEQARLLRRLCREVIFLYDDDEAGQHAMLRGTEILLAQEFSVRCVSLKQGEDPDSFLRLQGADAFAERLSHARPFFEHFLTQAMQKNDTSTVPGRVAVVETMAPFIRLTPNAILAEDYLQRLAEALSLSSDVVRAHLKVGARRRPEARAHTQESPAETTDSLTLETTHRAEIALLRILIDYPESASKIVRFNAQWVEHPVIRRQVEKAIAAAAQNPLTWQALLEEASAGEQSLLRQIALMEETISDSFTMLEQTCRRLEIRYKRNAANALSRQLSGAGMHSLEETGQQLRQIHEIHQQRHEALARIRALQDEKNANDQSSPDAGG